MVVEMALSTQPPFILPASSHVIAHRLLSYLLLIWFLIVSIHTSLLFSFTPLWIPIPFPFSQPVCSVPQLRLSFPPLLPLSSYLPFHTVFYPVSEHIQLFLGAMVWQESRRTSKKESLLAHSVYSYARAHWFVRRGTAVISQSDYDLLFLTSSVKLPQTASKQTTPQAACNNPWHQTGCKVADDRRGVEMSSDQRFWGHVLPIALWGKMWSEWHLWHI